MARETFQTRLKRAMESAGLKQVDLVRIAAERGAKLGKSQVSQYVSGKVTPRRDVMELLAGVLGVTPQWLMGAADAMPDDVAPEAAAPQAPSASRQKTTDQGSVTMREFKKSSKLDNVLYDVRGPVVDEAARMEEDGARILKLNIGNPAPFGFRAPDEVVYDMRQQLTDCEGYSDSRGLFAARKAIMQYAQLRNIPNVDMKHIYTGNGVSELIQLSMHALIDDGDEVLVPSPDYPLWTACVTLAGGHAVHYVCDEQNEWNPDLADMESKVTSRTKAIVVINPNNPTGAVYSKEVLEGIVEIARKHQLIDLCRRDLRPPDHGRLPAHLHCLACPRPSLRDLLGPLQVPHGLRLPRGLDGAIRQSALHEGLHLRRQHAVQHAPVLQRARAVNRPDGPGRLPERQRVHPSRRPRLRAA